MSDPMGLDTRHRKVKPTRIILLAAAHYADAEQYALTELRADSKTLDRGWAGAWAGSGEITRWRARYVSLPVDTGFVQELRSTRARPVELRLLPGYERDLLHGELVQLAKSRHIEVVEVGVAT